MYKFIMLWIIQLIAYTLVDYSLFYVDFISTVSNYDPGIIMNSI